MEQQNELHEIKLCVCVFVVVVIVLLENVLQIYCIKMPAPVAELQKCTDVPSVDAESW